MTPPPPHKKKNIHKSLYPKNILFSENPRKKTNFKILTQNKLPAPTYVWKYQSTIPLPPPPASGKSL